MNDTQRLEMACIMQNLTSKIRHLMMNRSQTAFTRCKYFDFVFEDIFGVKNFGKDLITSPNDTAIAKLFDDFGMKRLLYLFNNPKVFKQLEQLIELREALWDYDKDMEKYADKDRIAPKKTREEYSEMKKYYSICIKRFKDILGVKKAPAGMQRFGALAELVKPEKKKKKKLGSSGNTLFRLADDDEYNDPYLFDDDDDFEDDDDYDDDDLIDIEAYRRSKRLKAKPVSRDPIYEQFGIEPGSEIDRNIKEAMRLAGLDKKPVKKPMRQRTPRRDDYDDYSVDYDDLSSFRKPASEADPVLEEIRRKQEEMYLRQEDIDRKFGFVLNALTGQARPIKDVPNVYDTSSAILQNHKEDLSDVKFRQLEELTRQNLESNKMIANALANLTGQKLAEDISPKPKRRIKTDERVIINQPQIISDDIDIDYDEDDDDEDDIVGPVYDYEYLVLAGETDQDKLMRSLHNEFSFIEANFEKSAELTDMLKHLPAHEAMIKQYCAGRTDVFEDLFIYMDRHPTVLMDYINERKSQQSEDEDDEAIDYGDNLDLDVLLENIDNVSPKPTAKDVDPITLYNDSHA